MIRWQIVYEVTIARLDVRIEAFSDSGVKDAGKWKGGLARRKRKREEKEEKRKEKEDNSGGQCIILAVRFYFLFSLLRHAFRGCFESLDNRNKNV